MNTQSLIKSGLYGISNGIHFAPGKTCRYQNSPPSTRLPLLAIKPVSFQPVAPSLTRPRTSKRWLAISGGVLLVVVVVASLVAIILVSQNRMHRIDNQKQTMAVARQLRYTESELRQARYESQQLRRDTISLTVQLAEYQTGKPRAVAVVRLNAHKKIQLARL